jgi:hypothetical protein
VEINVAPDHLGQLVLDRCKGKPRYVTFFKLDEDVNVAPGSVVTMQLRAKERAA